MTTEITPLQIKLNDMTAQDINDLINAKAINLGNRTIPLALEIIDEIIDLANKANDDFLKQLNAMNTIDKQSFKSSGTKLNLTRDLLFFFAENATTDYSLFLSMTVKLENFEAISPFVSDLLEKERLKTIRGDFKTWGYIPNIIIDTTDSLEALPNYIKGSLVRDNPTDYEELKTRIKGIRSESIRLETNNIATPITTEDGDSWLAFSTEYFALPTPDSNLELLDELNAIITKASINENENSNPYIQNMTIEEKNARNVAFNKALEANPDATHHINTLGQVSSTLLNMFVNEDYHKGVNPVLLELMAKNPLVKQFFYLGIDNSSYPFANTNRIFDDSLEITKEIFNTAIKHNVLTSEAQNVLNAIRIIEPHYMHAKQSSIALTIPTEDEEELPEPIIEQIAANLETHKEELFQKPKVKRTKKNPIDDNYPSLFDFDYSSTKQPVQDTTTQFSIETNEPKETNESGVQEVKDTERMTLSERILVKNRKDAQAKEQDWSMVDLAEAISGKTIQIPTTKEERIEANLKAVKLLFSELSDRKVRSFEEYETLKRYTGWGALGSDIVNEDGEVVKTLSSVLDSTQLDALKASITSAYYTPPHVVSSMVKQISEKLFNKEHEFMHILEPSCGNGQVISALYEAFPNARIVGVELDPITALIAKKMFLDKRVKIIQADFLEACNYCGDVIFKEGKEDETVRQLKFDLVIGNPPYGVDFKPQHDHFDGGNSSNWEEFFTNASANLLNDGGILSFVVPSRCMDKPYHWEKEENVSAKSKNYLALNNVEFKTGVRLPINTFRSTNTSIDTDIIILQKKTELSEKSVFRKFDTAPLSSRNFIDETFEPFSTEIINRMKEKSPNTFFDLCDLANKEHAKNKGIDPFILVPNAHFLGLSSLDYVELVSEKVPNYLASHLRSFNQFLVFDNEKLLEKNDLYFTFAKDRFVKTEFQLELRGNLDQNQLNNMLSSAIEKTNASSAKFETPTLKHDLTQEEILELLGRSEKENEISDKVTIISKNDDLYQEVSEATKFYRNGSVFKIDDTYFRLNALNWKQRIRVNDSNDKDIKLTKIDANDPTLSDPATIAYFDLRDTYLKLINLEETSSEETKDIEEFRASLNTKYDSFVQKYFYLNSKKAQTSECFRCPHYRNVASLEKQYIEPNKSKGIREAATKSDIFSERTIFPVDNFKVNNLTDALLLSVKQSGKVDLAATLDIHNKNMPSPLSFEEMVSQLKKEGLIFKNPKTNNYELGIYYLRGHIPTRIAEAKAKLEEDPSLAHNIEALEKMIPPLPSKDDVKPLLGCSYVDLETYEDFLVFAFKSLKGLERSREEVKLKYSEENNGLDEKGTDIIFDQESIRHYMFDRFTVRKKERVDSMGNSLVTRDIKGHTVLEYALNPHRSIMIRTTNPDTKKSELDEVATDAISNIRSTLQEMFAKWIFSDEKRTEKVLTAYRDKYLAIATPNYDKFTGLLALDGLSKNITLRKHQIEGSIFSMFNKNTMFNHCVGAGKTYAAIVSVVSQVKQGLVKKAAIVVPNYLVGQWGNEILKLAPNAYCYVANEKDTSLKERAKFFANIASNNYDFVVLGHTHLKLLQNDIDFMQKESKEKLNKITNELKAFVKSGQMSDFKYQQAVNRETFAVESEMSQELTKLPISFKQMGIDFLVIDESHFFKNLPYKTQLRGVKGLGTPSGSARAKDLLWKTKLFQDTPNAKVMFLSGTPITNSIVEVYGLMQYLAPDLLQNLNVNGLDDFIKDFAVAKEGFEMNLDAKTFKRTERLSEFTNLHALRSLLLTFTHTVSLEDLKEQNKGIVPEIERQEHFVPRSLAQEEAYEALGERINRLQIGMRKDDNHLLILHDARSIAADVRLKDLSAKVDEQETKNAYIAERIFRSYLKNNEIKGTQLVYYAINSPKAKSHNIDPTFEGQKREIDALIEKRKQEALEREMLDKERQLQERLETAVRAGKSKEEIDKIIQEATTSVIIDDDPNSKEQKSDDEIYAASLDNSDSIAQRGHTGFCIASNLLRHLVSMGIPQNEIAFVNDFTTIEAKVQMQQMVNKGEIRVLIGSYYNMGVGLNVHERLTDIHLAECPFRPDMITQAIGRIERSGHPLMHSVKDFKAQVNYYGVKETIEANLYGLNAIKSKIAKDLFDLKAELNNSFTDDIEDEQAIYQRIQANITGNQNALNYFAIRQTNKTIENKIINFYVQKNYLEQSARLERAILLKKQEAVGEAKNKIDFFAAMSNDLHANGNEKMLNVFIPKFFPNINNKDMKNDVEYNAFTLSENALSKSSKELTPEENTTKTNFLIALGKRIRDLTQIFSQKNYLPKELTLMSFGGDFRIIAGCNPDAEKSYSFFIAHHKRPTETTFAPFGIRDSDQFWIVSYAHVGAYETIPQEKEKDSKYLDAFYVKIANKFMDKFEKFLKKTLNDPLGLQQDHQKASDGYAQKLAATNDLQETLETLQKEFDVRAYETLRDLIREDEKELKANLSSPDKKDEVVELKHKEYAETKRIKLT